MAVMRNMTPSADQTMAALLENLHQRGLLDSTLVMMITEFGRTPKINEATVALAMGLDTGHVEHSPSGRPFTPVDKGKPVMELFG
jgi:uncharacterized protein (DUF1501 family)